VSASVARPDGCRPGAPGTRRVHAGGASGSVLPLRGSWPTGSLAGILAAAGCACGMLAGAAQAADSTEVWPELDVFYGLSPTTRLFLGVPYTTSAESDTQGWSLEGYLDVSIKPILRKYLQTEDWQRSRYFWIRVGYARVGKATNGQRQTPEDRGVVAITARAPLPAEIWLEGRARADLRWIDGVYSNRYRVRIEANRELTVRERAVAPYCRVEWFYDTRYDGLSRTLYEAGTEVTLHKHFRYEIYLARQNDRLPKNTTLNALGFTAKWYY
jgi:Protein of unknown function (DUF2490)